MFRQKKLNRFLYRNVRAMSLYSTAPTHMGTLKKSNSPRHTTEPTRWGFLKKSTEVFIGWRPLGRMKYFFNLLYLPEF